MSENYKSLCAVDELPKVSINAECAVDDDGDKRQQDDEQRPDVFHAGRCIA